MRVTCHLLRPLLCFVDFRGVERQNRNNKERISIWALSPAKVHQVVHQHLMNTQWYGFLPSSPVLNGPSCVTKNTSVPCYHLCHFQDEAKSICLFLYEANKQKFIAQVAVLRMTQNYSTVNLSLHCRLLLYIILVIQLMGYPWAHLIEWISDWNFRNLMCGPWNIWNFDKWKFENYIFWNDTFTYEIVQILSFLMLKCTWEPCCFLPHESQQTHSIAQVNSSYHCYNIATLKKRDIFCKRTVEQCESENLFMT